MSAVPPDIRAAVLRRDGMNCLYCGVVCLNSWECRQDHPRMATIDHVIPQGLGGTDDLANLKTACQRCNNDKGMALDFTLRPPPPAKLPPLIYGEASRELARRIVRGERG